MIKVILNIIILLQAVTCKSLAESEAKAGFSVACQGPRSIGQMTKTAEIVTEAVVVDVSPARDNVYAVTLQVRHILIFSNDSGSMVFKLGNVLGSANIQRKASRWRAGSWTFCSIVVFEAKDQEKIQIR